MRFHSNYHQILQGRIDGRGVFRSDNEYREAGQPSVDVARCAQDH